jgi:hypothetical protein
MAIASAELATALGKPIDLFMAAPFVIQPGRRRRKCEALQSIPRRTTV